MIRSKLPQWESNLAEESSPKALKNIEWDFHPFSSIFTFFPYDSVTFSIVYIYQNIGVKKNVI